jgi:hypothetical protein
MEITVILATIFIILAVINLLIQIRILIRDKNEDSLSAIMGWLCAIIWALNFIVK